MTRILILLFIFTVGCADKQQFFVSEGSSTEIFRIDTAKNVIINPKAHVTVEALNKLMECYLNHRK